ncbi:MAG: hypothetical protein FWH31_09315 [Streptococcaceae bacterium]|nr:hypothetical protein [Streptococcaceae bacterium]
MSKKEKFQNLCYAKILEISYLHAFSTMLSIGLPFGVAALAAYSQCLLLLGL